MKIHLKDQTKKTEEENTKTWHAKKPNIKKILMGGWLAIDMQGHGMACYEFSVTWVCFTKEPIKIRFCEKNSSNPTKERERDGPKQNMLDITFVPKSFPILSMFNILQILLPSKMTFNMVK